MAGLRTLHPCQAELGEGPVWDPVEQALWWVDIHARALYRLDWSSGAVERFTAPDVIGSFALRARGGMVVALQSGLFTFDPRTGESAPIVQPESHIPTNRFNEGKCDRLGRFWAGTMSDVAREPTGSLYRLDPDGTLTTVFGDVIVPNCLAFNPDNRFMYFADTWRHVIRRHPFDLTSGRIGEPEVFVDLHGRPGAPDGGTVDAEGCLWNAEFGGGRVVRYTPEGKIDRVVELPVTQITCCAFAGPALDTLVITTAKRRLDEAERARQRQAGDLFAIDVGVKGLPETRFAG